MSRMTLLLSLSLALVACKDDGDDTVTPSDSVGGSDSDAGPTDADGDGYDVESDCDDADPNVFPGAEEACDGLDNNCDGATDEGVTSTFYQDADGDGYGDDAAPVEACEAPEGAAAQGGDCDDADVAFNPGAAETDCEDPNDYNCDGSTGYADGDGDGFAACQECDDGDVTVNPSALEVCDERDNNCDGAVDEGVTSTFYQDADADGYGDADFAAEACEAPAGYAADSSDCDDAAAAVNPGALEVCNGLDDDCDALTDDADDSLDDSTAGVFYSDRDADGYGDPDAALTACAQPSGAVTDSADCDDGDKAVNPAASEVCDGADNNCDGVTDTDAVDLVTYYTDSDADGYGDASAAVKGCSAPAGSVSDSTDCDDGDKAVNPAAKELCDSVDNNCDGLTDDSTSADASTWYQDADKDGYGTTSVTQLACSRPSGYVGNKKDCDDTDKAIYTGATEVCDTEDNDCDGTIDESDAADAKSWYKDADKDGYGDPSAVTKSCSSVSGTVSDNTDCDDSDDDVYPGAPELCSGDDTDCDGVTPNVCEDCMEALSDGYTADGMYTIDTDGASGALSPVDVYCDMTTDGGGWTLVQRTLWDWTDSKLLLTGYSTWYGSTLGAADAGEAFRLAGRSWPTVGASGDMLAVHYARDRSSTKDCDPLYYTGDGGTWSVTSSATSYSGWTSTVTLANTTALSTSDSGASSYCVTGYNAIPWFYTSCCTTCPTFLGGYWTDSAHPMASYLDSTKDHYGNTTASVCPSGNAVVSSGYEGVNTMEIYLR